MVMVAIVSLDLDSFLCVLSFVPHSFLVTTVQETNNGCHHYP